MKLASLHPAALPHGPLVEVFEGIHVVTGTTCPTFLGRSWQFSRNMTVVVHDGALTVVNSVRLDDTGLRALERLGRVENVVRLGAFHGMDDAFYLERYDARLWALPGMVHESGRETDELLIEGGAMPFPEVRLIPFVTSKLPEALLLVARDGGVLLACDSLQSWAEPDPYFDESSATAMAQMGFFRRLNVGPGFRSACEPAASDFERILTLPFVHFVGAHGTPIRADAKSACRETFEDLYGIRSA